MMVDRYRLQVMHRIVMDDKSTCSCCDDSCSIDWTVMRSALPDGRRLTRWAQCLS
jgi:hypothetical protein